MPGEGALSRRANHGRHLREKHHPRGRADETLQQRYRQRGHDVAELEKATGEASDAAVEGEARGAHHISLARQGKPEVDQSAAGEEGAEGEAANLKVSAGAEDGAGDR